MFWSILKDRGYVSVLGTNMRIWQLSLKESELWDIWGKNQGTGGNSVLASAAAKTWSCFSLKVWRKISVFPFAANLGMCKWKREGQGSLYPAQQYFWRQFVRAWQPYDVITDSFFFDSFSSFPFWQLKSGWENFSLWFPPFLVFCSSWNKTFEMRNVLNTWKIDFPCHLCWRPVLQDSKKSYFCAIIKIHGALFSSLCLFVEIPFVIMQLLSVLPCSYFDSKVL